MASASSTSARSLFGESKIRLADKVQVNVNNIASVVRQIQRGSKSNEVIFLNIFQYYCVRHNLVLVFITFLKLHLLTA